MEPLRSVTLPNGLTVEFLDRSNRYFGDYYRLCIEVRCRIALRRDLFRDRENPAEELQRARKLLGEEVLYRRELVQMAVPTAALVRTREAMMDEFLATAGPYLGSEAFPVRFAARCLAEKRKNRLRPVPR